MPIYHSPNSRQKIRRMNLRQRKKFHLAEFKNLTFNMQGALLPEYQTAECFNQFIDDVIDWLVTRHDVATLQSGNLIDGYYAAENEWESYPHVHK